MKRDYNRFRVAGLTHEEAVHLVWQLYGETIK